MKSDSRNYKCFNSSAHDQDKSPNHKPKIETQVLLVIYMLKQGSLEYGREHNHRPGTYHPVGI